MRHGVRLAVFVTGLVFLGLAAIYGERVIAFIAATLRLDVVLGAALIVGSALAFALTFVAMRVLSFVAMPVRFTLGAFVALVVLAGAIVVMPGGVAGDDATARALAPLAGLFDGASDALSRGGASLDHALGDVAPGPNPSTGTTGGERRPGDGDVALDDEGGEFAWTDEEGNLHITTTPPPPGATLLYREKRRTTTSEQADAVTARPPTRPSAPMTSRTEARADDGVTRDARVLAEEVRMHLNELRGSPSSYANGLRRDGRSSSDPTVYLLETTKTARALSHDRALERVGQDGIEAVVAGRAPSPFAGRLSAHIRKVGRAVEVTARAKPNAHALVAAIVAQRPDLELVLDREFSRVGVACGLVREDAAACLVDLSTAF